MTRAIRKALMIKPKRAPVVARVIGAWVTLLENPEMPPDEIARVLDISPPLAHRMATRHRFLRDYSRPISGNWFADAAAPEPTIH